MGESCTRPFPENTTHKNEMCTGCEKVARKQRRKARLEADVERFTRENKNPATVSVHLDMIAILDREIMQIRADIEEGQMRSLSFVRGAPRRPV